MKKTLQFACISLSLAALLACTGCVVYGPGPGGYYAYDYYPDADVYYYPVGGYYYWNDGGVWVHGRNLPAHYAIHPESRQSFQAHTQHPWTENHPSGGSGGWHH